jgi:uncharacterized protein (DUF2236 family)
VHATLVDTALVTYETFVQPLTQHDREEFYQQMKLLGEVLGVPRDRFPTGLADFDAYMESMINNGPVQVDARAYELSRDIRRPRVRVVPGLAMVPFDVVTAGLLPAALREQFRLPWGRGQRRAYRFALKTLPRVVALTPPLLRVWPLPGHSVTYRAAATS